MRNKRSQEFRKRKDDGSVEATVLEILPADIYKLQLGDDREVLAHRAGKLIKNKISVFIGDRVKVVLDPYGGKTTNRITFRL